MSGLPWFRLYSEMVDDEKLRLLAFEDRWHFVALLCCKCAGLLDAGDAPGLLRRKLSVKLGLASRELDAMVERLAELHLVDFDTLQPVAWEERQFKSDSSRERVRSFRDRMKRPRNVTETAQDTDTDTDTNRKEQKLSAQPSVSRFDEFWAAYPQGHKVGKKPAEQKWRSRKLDAIADRLIADVLNRAANDDGWLRGYVPDPCTYLNQERWGDELRTAPVARAGPPAAPGKQMQGLMALEEMKRGLVRNRDTDGATEAGVLLLGSDPRR